jgi:hypothetical protein
MLSGVDVNEFVLPLATIADETSKLVLDETQLDMVSKGQAIRGVRSTLPETKVIFGVGNAGELACTLVIGDVTPEGLAELKPAKVFI